MAWLIPCFRVRLSVRGIGVICGLRCIVSNVIVAFCLLKAMIFFIKIFINLCCICNYV